MAEGKRPRLLKDPGDWWKVSRYVPEGKQDVVLLALGGAAAFLLVLTVILAMELAGAGGETEDAEDRIEELEGDLEEAGKETEKWTKTAGTARAESKKLAADLEETSAKLSGLQAELQEAGGRIERLDALARTKDRKIDELNPELARMKERLAEAAKYKAEAARLAAKVKANEAELAAFRDQSREVLGEKADLVLSLRKNIVEQRAFIDKVTGQLRQREQEVLDLADRNEEVEGELRKFPVEPFTEQDAARKYREIMDEVAAYQERDMRIPILFRAKLLLAGTNYEAKAHTNWRNERKQKQADVDREAKVVYDKAKSKTKMHPEAYDKNISIMRDALEQVRGSKYEEMIEKEIDKLHEEKARAGAGG